MKYQTIIAFTFKNKYIIHCRYGDAHRLGHPAVVWSDHDMFWFQYGDKHRKDGPARIWDQIKEYWIRDEEQC
jgi:hypothetical protein